MKKFMRYYVGRVFLGNVLRVLNFITRKAPVKRSAEAQAEIDKVCATMELYHFSDCPFCIKVLRFMHQENININLRDAAKDTKSRDALFAGGGKHQVPCLHLANARGKDTWLYESDDVISYLKSNLAL